MYAYEDWTKAQKMRWLFGWLSFGVIFLITDWILHLVLNHRFPRLPHQIVSAITLSVSTCIAAVLGFGFYQFVLVRLIRDSD